MAHENGNTNGTCVSERAVLLIGAGGVGCEVLKNLVLCGVESITVIDLDTIEVSNLNRQFLFRREHVGKPKAIVAVEAMRKIRPSVNLQAVHGNVLDSNVLSINFIRQFACVINALDNILARSHVNRLCMAATIPLIETGSSGYMGQACVIAKGLTLCYDCTPRVDDRNKTYPACTIRNTPSEPAHCVIWAKYLFGQLFGEADPDSEVSPDPDDPELNSAKSDDKTNGQSKPAKVNTRQWAEQILYDPNALLNKLFREDITYLLRLDSLWKKRVPPVPLDFSPPTSNGGECSDDKFESDIERRDHQVWTQAKCVELFSKSVKLLRERMTNEGSLTFDKDDDLAIDFVTSAANLRSTVFHIAGLKRFSVKSIAGNIIAAIATTNSVVAGSAVILAALNVLSKSNKGKGPQNALFNNIREVNFRRFPVASGRAKNRTKSIFSIGSVEPPNAACYVCSPASKSATLFELAFDFTDKGATPKAIRERLLMSKLHFACPEVVMSNGRMIISGDEEDNDERAMNRTLNEAGISSGSIFLAEDMSQNISVSLSFSHVPGITFDEALENFQGARPETAKPADPQPVRPVSRKRQHSGDGSPSGSPVAKKTANGTGSNGHANNNNSDVCVIDDDNFNKNKTVVTDIEEDDCIFVS